MTLRSYFNVTSILFICRFNAVSVAISMLLRYCFNAVSMLLQPCFNVRFYIKNQQSIYYEWSMTLMSIYCKFNKPLVF